MKAVTDGRFHVSFKDVQDVAYLALRHRLILNFEAHAEGVTPDSIVQNLVSTMPVEAA